MMTRAEEILEIALAGAGLAAAGAIGSQLVQKRAQKLRREEKVRQSGMGDKLDKAKKNVSTARKKGFLSVNPVKARRNIKKAKASHQRVMNKGLAKQAHMLSSTKDHKKQAELNN